MKNSGSNSVPDFISDWTIHAAVMLSPLEQYVADVRTVQKLLQEAEETIGLINKEEDFYNWDLSCYPEVEVIKERIDPYQKLFGFILKWQRTENR